MKQHRITPVILSGGSGTRLWPLSRPTRPKQMLPLTGPESMLELTLRRVEDLTLFNPAVIVASEAHADEISALFQHAHQPPSLILEPCARGTAAAIALAALAAGEDELLLVMPSDHLIRDVDAFRRAIDSARPLAQAGWLATFGIKPDRPETGYGYIKRGDQLADGVWQAERFVEKPAIETARIYLADGGYDWNGGIFFFSAGAFRKALEEHAPAILAAAKAAMESARRDANRTIPEAVAFGSAPSESIDNAVMEKAARIAVVPVAMGWSDVGSWDSLHEIASKDDAGNVISGAVTALDTKNCLIRSHGPTVAAVGVKDLVVIATADAILIVPREQSQRVKEAVEALKSAGHPSFDG